MCGITGYSGHKNFNTDKIKLLMYWNSIERKSTDATGIYTPINKIMKSTKTASQFFYDEKTIFLPDKMLIGHVRAKTVGGNFEKNAHPFNYGDIVLCHNGTLSNHIALARKENIPGADWDVDSQVIAWLLNKRKDPTVLSEIDGAAAVLFTDTTKSGKLYAYRNSDRPLYRGTVDGSMYISSEANALKAIGCSNVKEFKEDLLYTIENGRILSQTKIKRFVAPVVVPETPTPYARNLDIYTKVLEGKWLQAQWSRGVWGREKIKLIEGEWYYCESYSPDNDWELFIWDESGKAVAIGKHAFNMHNFLLVKDKFANVMVTLNKKDGPVILKEDDVVYIQDVNHIKKVATICTMDTGEVYEINFKYLRPADPKDEERFFKILNCKTRDTCSVETDKKEKEEEDMSEEETEDIIEYAMMSPEGEKTFKEFLMALDVIVDKMKSKPGINMILAEEFNELEKLIVETSGLLEIEDTETPDDIREREIAN